MKHSFYCLYADTSIHGTPTLMFVDSDTKDGAIQAFLKQIGATLLERGPGSLGETEIWVEFTQDKHNAHYTVRPHDS